MRAPALARRAALADARLLAALVLAAPHAGCAPASASSASPARPPDASARRAHAVARECTPAPVCPPVAEPPSLEISRAWRRLRELADAPADAVDPAEVNLLVAQARDPSVDVASVLARIDAMASAVRDRLPARCDHRCRIRALDRYLFDVEGYRAESDPSGLYRDLNRNVVDRVIAARAGYCEGLSTLYVALGRRLGVPLALVPDRQHVYVRYVGREVPAFDIDPTRRGLPPEPERAPCAAAPGVYGVPVQGRVMIGRALALVGTADGFIARPWLDAAVALAPDQPELRNNRGVERNRWFDPRGAVAEFRAAARLDPCVALFRANEARALETLGRRAEADAALADLEARVARGAVLPDGRLALRLARAHLARERGDDAAAEREILAALEDSGGAAVALEALAGLRVVQGREREAVTEMRAAVAADGSVRTRVGLVTALLGADDVAGASEELARIVSERPTPGSLDALQAALAAREGREADAASYATRCLARLGLRCAGVLVSLGDAARQRGDAYCARRYYEAFLGCGFPTRGRAAQVLDASVRARLAAVAAAGR